jgi:protein arginine N-methyltransferase 1
MHNKEPILSYHHRLIADETRVTAFERAIASAVRPGDVVLDLGSGTGILALMACRAGAERVYAVESGAVGDIASSILRVNDRERRVTLVRRNSLHVQLPERVDVLIGEIIGNVGLDEGIVGSFIDARTRFLKPEGRLVPSRVEVVVAPVATPAELESTLSIWEKDIKGFDYSGVATFARQQIYKVRLDRTELQADPLRIIDVDLRSVTEPFHAGRVSFPMPRAARVGGLAGWFRVTLGESGDVLSNEPPNTASNWSQGFFPFGETVNLQKGAQLEVELSTFDGSIWRWQIRAVDVEGHLLRQFDHSTFGGFPLRAGAVRNRSSRHQPISSALGRAAAFVLQNFDGHRTCDELVERVEREYPGLFPTRSASRAFLSRLVEEYAGHVDDL